MSQTVMSIWEMHGETIYNPTYLHRLTSEGKISLQKTKELWTVS